jgi:hypothetical protein
LYSVRNAEKPKTSPYWYVLSKLDNRISHDPSNFKSLGLIVSA